MFRGLNMFLGGVLLCIGGLQAQQPRIEARIEGLEKNGEYMSLLYEDARLQMREDSVVNAVEGLRQLLRENPENGQAYSDEILELESRIFEIRNAKGRLIDRINTIEQEWVLANLNGAAGRHSAAAEEFPAIPDSLKVRNLVANPYFRERLPEADYAALLRAQELEMRAVDYVNRYYANYATLSELAEAYEAAAAEAEALDIESRYAAIEGLNRVLADSLAQTWNFIFDNKNYAYGYLLDERGQDELLSRGEERNARAARALSALRGETASDELADYFLRKKALVGYETDVAEALGLHAAQDSLQGVAEQLAAVDFRLPRRELQERYFLDFDSVAFSKNPVYSYQHPIPECKVYARGTIYRILLGRFNTKRAAATFRGAYPLCYRIDEEGKWCYYAGGYATLLEAEAAQKLLKKHGFVRPEIVVWNDGAMRNITRDGENRSVAYRVEITGADELSEETRRAIAQAGEGDLSRVGQGLFVVGMFADRAVAERVAAAVRQTDPQLEINVAEIAE